MASHCSSTHEIHSRLARLTSGSVSFRWRRSFITLNSSTKKFLSDHQKRSCLLCPSAAPVPRESNFSGASSFTTQLDTTSNPFCHLIPHLPLAPLIISYFFQPLFFLLFFFLPLLLLQWPSSSYLLSLPSSPRLSFLSPPFCHSPNLLCPPLPPCSL